MAWLLVGFHLFPKQHGSILLRGNRLNTFARSVLASPLIHCQAVQPFARSHLLRRAVLAGGPSRRYFLHETREQFVRRLGQVEDHVNSAAFAAAGSGVLLALAKSMPERCREVIKRGGERLPK